MKRPTALYSLFLRLAAATIICFAVTSTASAQYQTANSGVLVNFQSIGIYSNPGNFVNATIAARLNGDGTVTIGGCISSNAPGIANATYSMNPFQIIDGSNGQVVGSTSFFNQNLPGGQTAIPFPVSTFTPSAPVVDGSRLEIVAQLILSDGNNFSIDTRGKVNGQNVSFGNPRPPGSYNYTTFRFSANSFTGTCGIGALPPCPTTSGSSFSAAPTSINQGQSSTLTWNVPNATSVTISGVGTFAPSGSVSVSPASTTTYTLTAAGPSTDCAPVTLQATVNVTQCPTAAGSSFSSAPTSIIAGQSSTLTWNVPNATSVTIAGVGTFGPSGSIAVSPTSTTTYTLTGDGAAGCTPVTLQATVTVCPSVGASSFTASPTTIVTGGNSTLSWSVPGADSVTIAGVGTFGASGSVSVSPSSSTTYTLTSSGAGSCAAIQLQTTVNVTPCPTVAGSTFTASPSSIVPGGSSTLSWNVPDATSVTISGVAGTFGASGSVSVSPAATTTYTLTANGAGACAAIQLQATVTVGSCPAVAGSSFTASPTTIALGGSSTLTWSIPNATSVTIGGVAGTFGSTGSVSVSPSSTTTYTLTAAGPGTCASIQLQATVNVTPCPTVAGSSFTASLSSIVPGDSSTLSWNVPNATSVTISGVPGTFGSSGSVSVSPASTTTYTLTATGAGTCSAITIQATVNVSSCPTVAGSTFTAAPTSINTGGSSTLTWNVPAATSVTISGVAGTFGASGSVTVSPSSSTTYTLTAAGPGTCASIQLQATVTVTACQTIVNLGASATTINQGQSTTLSYTLTGATSATITDLTSGTATSVPVQSGSLVVTPPTTRTYRLAAVGPCATVTQDITITVNPAVVINSFAASVSPICTGQSTTLSWSATNGTSATISAPGLPGSPVSVNPVSGTLSVSPTTTTTYTLTVNGAGGQSATSQTTVVVNTPPTINTFAAAPATINPGDSSTLSWTTTNATFTVITDLTTGSNIGVFAPNDSLTVTPASTRSYRLTADNGLGCGTVTRDLTVTVNSCQTITSLSASATTINQGQSTIISYVLANATSATITDLSTGTVTSVPVQSGSLTVSPATTRTYRLSAAGACATVTQDITITVNPLVVINSFAASASPICAGQSSNLSWSISNASSATISAPGLPGSPVTINPVSGTLTVTPSSTTTYTLTANGAGGQSVTSQTTVTVNQPPTINTFTGTPANINAGQSTTLSWTTTGAAYTVLTDLASGSNIAVFAPNDSYVATPPTTRTYRLTAADAAGCALPTREVTITVTACQTITSFTATPSAITTGSTTTLTWATSGASSVDVIDVTNTMIVATGQPANGSLTVTPASTTLYRLRANGPCAPQTQDVTVTVCPAASASTFTAVPATINVGQSATLSWNVPNASTVTISGVAGTFGPSGSTTVSPAATTTYTLTAQGDSGCAPVTLQATVTVVACPTVAGSTFSAAPASIGPGQSSTLSWSVPNATSVTISGVAGTFAASGSVTVTPSVTTTYTLTAQGGAGCAAIQLQTTVTVTPCQIINALTVNGFSSDTNAAEGSTVTVAWDISNYTSASITVYINGNNSGSFPLTTPQGSRTFTQPSSSLTFVMVVDGSCQQLQLARYVYTVPCPTAAGSSFTATPATISAGQSSTLSWIVPNAVAVTISGVAATFGPSGSVSVSPAATTTYTLTASGASGCAPVTLQATVVVCAVKINSFTATPATIMPGGSSTLAWDISNTTQVLINTTNGTGSYFNLPASGTLNVTPATTTTYQLVALSDNDACSDTALTTVTVQATGAVLIGPQGRPDAVGPTSNNDDYTNLTMTVGVAAPQGGLTTSPQTLTFINTIRNDATAADNIVLTAPVVPAGFTVEVEVGLDDATGDPVYVSIGGPGQATNFNLPAATQQDVRLRITAPAGISVLAGYSTVLRATSSLSPQVHNDTIDRVWSGFVSAVKTQNLTNTTGVGAVGDAVSGAIIEYVLDYANVTTASGTGNVNLTATNVVLTEDGNALPNNWASTTTHVPGSASDTRGGAITGDVPGSTLLTDTVPSLAPGQSGVFKFRRVIK